MKELLKIQSALKIKKFFNNIKVSIVNKCIQIKCTAQIVDTKATFFSRQSFKYQKYVVLSTGI